MRANVEFPVFGNDAASLHAKAMQVLSDFAPQYTVSFSLDVEPVGVTVSGEILGWRGIVKATISR